jgi:hypothetical protein
MGVYFKIFHDYFLPVSPYSLTLLYSPTSSRPSAEQRHTIWSYWYLNLLVSNSSLQCAGSSLFLFLQTKSAFSFFSFGDYIQCSQQCNILPILWNARSFFFFIFFGKWCIPFSDISFILLSSRLTVMIVHWYFLPIISRKWIVILVPCLYYYLHTHNFHFRNCWMTLI